MDCRLWFYFLWKQPTLQTFICEVRVKTGARPKVRSWLTLNSLFIAFQINIEFEFELEIITRRTNNRLNCAQITKAMNEPFICFERKLNGSCFAKPNNKIKLLYFVEHDRSLGWSFFLCIKQVVLTACDLAGLWYAVNTLLQILRLFHGTGIPQVQVSFIKWPLKSSFIIMWARRTETNSVELTE